MGKRVRQPTPRAHWALLALLMLVLLAELSLNGYVTHVGAGGAGEAPVADSGGGQVPAAVLDGAAVQRITADGSVSSRAMPARTIALTFDDGPDPVWMPRILAVLARYRAHATFFQVGSRVNEHPEISRQVVAQGSEIGSPRCRSPRRRTR
jgi:peptidoglycan/xylan/chitin deacetylase (PgdA/CDA1 family)